MVEKNVEGSTIENLVKLAAERCFVNFQDGGFLGTGWFELTGGGVRILQELLKVHGDEGLARFNQEYALLLEERLKRQVQFHDAEFQALLPNVDGAPYDQQEIERLQRMGVDTSSLVTTDDYRATLDAGNAYQRFLGEYATGAQMEVVIPTSLPDSFQSEAINEEWAVGHFPKGSVIILQKPVENKES